MAGFEAGPRPNILRRKPPVVALSEARPSEPLKKAAETLFAQQMSPDAVDAIVTVVDFASSNSLDEKLLVFDVLDSLYQDAHQREVVAKKPKEEEAERPGAVNALRQQLEASDPVLRHVASPLLASFRPHLEQSAEWWRKTLNANSPRSAYIADTYELVDRKQRMSPGDERVYGAVHTIAQTTYTGNTQEDDALTLLWDLGMRERQKTWGGTYKDRLLQTADRSAPDWHTGDRHVRARFEGEEKLAAQLHFAKNEGGEPTLTVTFLATGPQLIEGLKDDRARRQSLTASD